MFVISLDAYVKTPGFGISEKFILWAESSISSNYKAFSARRSLANREFF
jgi:hypothetical protein